MTPGVTFMLCVFSGMKNVLGAGGERHLSGCGEEPSRQRRKGLPQKWITGMTGAPCSSEDRPVEISPGCRLGFASRDKPGYEARRRPLFHLPPATKGTAGLRKGGINGHKRSDGGGDKVFSEGGRRKARGSRGPGC